MRSDCPQIGDVLLAGGPGSGHPLRTHIDTCARCRALLAARDHFLADPPAANADEAARLADADRQLAAFAGSLDTGGRRRSFPWPFGLAAAVVAAAGLWLLAPNQETAPRDGILPPSAQVWRGGGSGPMAGPAPAAESLADGGVRLSWAAVDNATRYEVVLLAADLTELSRWDAGSAATLILAPGVLPDGGHGGFFAVAAFAADRELGHWAPVLLP